ncbi:U3 small nucleolar RNA-associated protein 15 homolog [Palaemon carinicauda]|uniref:U3 small nucleolar RNA-associated protein 15 homolog n=1 Tax=Palaemon carinicauda TaxID=392227 RepID=UPI0035B5C478
MGLHHHIRGNEVRVWDAVGGKILSKLCQHHKTITSLAFATDKKRLLSGSLDSHVKIYDVSTYTVVHSLDFPAPVLCMGVAPKDSTLVVGMISGGSGLISFQHRRTETAKTRLEKDKTKKARDIVIEDTRMRVGDHVVNADERAALSEYDIHLRKYQYSKALDAVLLPYVCRVKPHVTVNVMRELIKRKGLKTAIAGRDAKELTRLMEFIKRNIRHPLYKQPLMDVVHALIDVYEDSLDESPALVKHFRNLRSEIHIEMELTREHASLMGVLQMFLTVSNTDDINTAGNTKEPMLLPQGNLAMPSPAKPVEKAIPMDLVEVN